MASLKSRQPPHTARLTTAPSRALSLGRYSSTRSAISTRVFELALPADVHLMCVRVHRSGWPRRAAALGRSWQGLGGAGALSRDLYRQRCHHRRPSTCSATREQRSRTASCRWPLVRARVRVRVRFRLLPVQHAVPCSWNQGKAHSVLSAIATGDATRVEAGERMDESV